MPVIAGQKSTLYVRERALPEVLRNGAGDKVVLFVHGAGTPAEVSFDVPYQDYSWMGYLAKAGYDVFSVDMTGYGRSARPAPMNDKCNLSPEQQKGFGVNCPAAYPGNLTNIESDWNDISAAVALHPAICAMCRRSTWSAGRKAGPAPAAGPPIIPTRWPS